MPLKTKSKAEQLDLFVHDIDLTPSQEEEALRLCKVHLISSVEDLLLIYKRGELRVLFPPLGLHAKVEAKLAVRSASIPLATACLPIVDTMPERDVSVATKQDEEKRTENNDLRRQLKEWFGRNAKRVRRFVAEHQCSA